MGGVGEVEEAGSGKLQLLLLLMLPSIGKPTLLLPPTPKSYAVLGIMTKNALARMRQTRILPPLEGGGRGAYISDPKTRGNIFYIKPQYNTLFALLRCVLFLSFSF